MIFTREDGKLLIKIARESISAYLNQEKASVDEKLRKRFSEKQGAFVTLNIDGELRGCIGYTEALYPLWETISKAAVAAAVQDPRFPPLTKEELDSVKVEVSVLTKPELMKGKPDSYPKQINIGKHGLVVEKDGYAGLLLPQVFTDYKSDSEKALEMTCQKAGLPSGAWKEPGCRVYSFSAQIFEEE